MESVTVESFRAEVQVGGAQFFCLAQEKVSAGLKVEVQPLEQSGTLRAGQGRKQVHTEDAVEAPDVNGPD